LLCQHPVATAHGEIDARTGGEVALDLSGGEQDLPKAAWRFPTAVAKCGRTDGAVGHRSVPRDQRGGSIH